LIAPIVREPRDKPADASPEAGESESPNEGSGDASPPGAEEEHGR